MLNLDFALKFNESNIKTINFDVINFDEIVSSINVSYYDRPLIKNSSFLLYENGIERTRGFAVSDNIDHVNTIERSLSKGVNATTFQFLSSLKSKLSTHLNSFLKDL